MKKILFLFFILFNGFATIAQPYFTDTLNTLPNLLSTPMGDVFELPNNQGYAVSNFANYDFNIIYTDINGQRVGQKKWQLFDTLICSFFIRTSTKMQNGNYALAVLLKNPTTAVYNTGIVMMNSTLTDTLWCKKYTYSTPNHSVDGQNLFYTKAAADGTFWALGNVVLDNTTLSIWLLHLNSNGVVLSQNHYPLSYPYNYPNAFILTPDGGCLLSVVEKQNSLAETNQVAFVKVNAAGQQEWYKSYGNPNYRDAYPFALRAANLNEYWLVYTEGLFAGNSPSSRIKGIRVNNAGVELETKYLVPYRTSTIRTYDALEDTDGNVTFGMIRGGAGVNVNVGCLSKFNANMDSLWLKHLPVPNYNNNNYEGTYPYHLIKAANGDYICSGEYFLPVGNNAIFLTRLDSTGCLVVGTENVAQQQSQQIKIYPNPASEYVNVDFLSENPRGTLYIYNAQGILITKTNITQNNTVISTNEWASGMYLYEYTSTEQEATLHGKLQIMH